MPRKISPSGKTTPAGLRRASIVAPPKVTLSKESLPSQPLQVIAPTAVSMETQVVPLVLMLCSVALLLAFGSSVVAGIVKMAGTVFTNDQYFLVKEAEHFNNEGSVSIKDDGDGFYVLMSGSDGVANLNTKITLTNVSLKTGQYNLWVKVIANATNRDSFMYKLPGQQNFLQHTIPTTSHSPTWQWRKIPFSYAASTSTSDSLSLAWRETKQFDKVIITNNLNFVPEPGRLLIGWWRFNGSPDNLDNYSLDSSPFSNTGFFNKYFSCPHMGLIQTSCKYGFDKDQYFDISKADNFFNPQGGTISVWVYPTASTTASYIIGGVGRNSDRYYIQWLSNGRFRIVRGNEDPYGTILTLTTNAAINNWYHITMSWDESKVYGYLNGRLVASAKYVASGTPASYVAYKDAPKFKIGTQLHATDNRSFPGQIDEVRFYGEKLSDTDISLIYGNEKSNSCVDSYDVTSNGQSDPFVRGETKGFLGEVYKVAVDSCVNGTTSTLAEYSCFSPSQGGEMKLDFINCANGCSNGACLKAEPWVQKGDSKGWIFYDMSKDGKYRLVSHDNLIVDVSSDFGNTWQSVSLSEAQMITGLAISEYGKYQVISPMNGYLSISSDFGNTWQLVTSTYVYVSSTVTSTGGWVSIPVAKKSIWHPEVSSDGSIIVAYESSKLIISKDYGRTWTTLITSDAGDEWKEIEISNDGMYILAASSKKIYLSNNGGSVWRNIDNMYHCSAAAMSFDGQKIALAVSTSTYVTKRSNIYVSQDFGNTWQLKLVEPNSNSWSSIAISDDGQKISAVAWGSNDIMMSKDYGNSWIIGYHSIEALGRAWQEIIMSRDGYYQSAIAQNDPIYYYPN